MRKGTLNFITHARTKDVVGRGLINNDNIAIIELIKNSKDAQSEDVEISFIEPDDNINGQILIADKGKGMSWDDIQFKWLNIAYSEKKNSKGPSGKAYAGNKGIGRFSCDRLGEKLDLYTKKKGNDWIKVEIDWTKFEVDQRDQEIAKIKLSVEDISKAQFESETKAKNVTSGTVLKITKLRNTWTNGKLVELKKELERFVIEPQETFEVLLDVKPDPANISGKIENRIFEQLDFRTTSIHAETHTDGKKIDISMRHDGEEVFKVTERSPYSRLRSLNASIYYLNQPAKAFFTRTTGYRSVEFGSIFLFLNGFRVFPYGDEGNDWLAIDRRKQQGYSRNLGTRELVGFIEIDDENGQFEAVSSREGLVQNTAFSELVSDEKNILARQGEDKFYGLIQRLIAKLQKFVVDGLDWDRIVGDQDQYSDAELIAGEAYQFVDNNEVLINTLDSVIALRSPRKYIEKIELNQDYLYQLAANRVDAYAEMIETLKSKFKDVGVPDLTPAQKRDLSKFIQAQSKELAAKEKSIQDYEEKTAALQSANTEITQQLSTEKKKRYYAESHLKSDDKRFQEIHHHIKILTDIVAGELDEIDERFQKDRKIPLADVISHVRTARFESQKMMTLTKIITKSDFDMMTDESRHDFFDAIAGYLDQMDEINGGWNMNIELQNPDNVSLTLNFSPIEQAILVDNILSNASKAEAKNVAILVQETNNRYVLSFTDDGNGLTTKYPADELFSAGISTTKGGSGTGLSNVRDIVDRLEGNVSIEKANPKGAVLKVWWDK